MAAKLFLTLVFFSAIEGYTAEIQQRAQIMTIEELTTLTQRSPVIVYWGTDTEFHYVSTIDDKHFKIRATELSIAPRPMPLQSDVGMFMQLKDGVLVATAPPAWDEMKNAFDDKPTGWFVFSFEKVVGITVLVAFLVFMLKRKYVFVIRIEKSEPRLMRGKVFPAFIDEIREVCRTDEIDSGTIKGCQSGRRIRLTFSNNLCPPTCQRIRNIWNLYQLRD